MLFRSVTTNTKTAEGTTKYRCVVTDSGKEKSTDENVNINTEIKVTVTDVFRISKQPVSMGVYTDKPGTLNIEVTGKVASYQWQYYDNRTRKWVDCTEGTGASKSVASVEAVGTEGLYTASDGVTKYISGTESYTFDSSTYAANGTSTQFRCIVKDVIGKILTSSTATVKQINHMAVTSKSNDVIIHKGESTVLKVTATGDGLKYQWQSFNVETGAWTDISRATSSSYTVTTNTKTEIGRAHV